MRDIVAHLVLKDLADMKEGNEYYLYPTASPLSSIININN
jgi:hypothetical protein